MAKFRKSEAGAANVEYALLASLLLLTALVAVGRVGQAAKDTFDLAAMSSVSHVYFDGGTQGGISGPEYGLPIFQGNQANAVDAPFAGE